MKEQVSVDKEAFMKLLGKESEYDKWIDKDNWVTITRQNYNEIIDERDRLKRQVTELNRICEFNEKTLQDLLDHAEKLEADNARLKRLEENVNKSTERLKHYAMACNAVPNKYKFSLEVLESLDK